MAGWQADAPADDPPLRFLARELRNGYWVLVAAGSEPVVVDAAVARHVRAADPQSNQAGRSRWCIEVAPAALAGSIRQELAALETGQSPQLLRPAPLGRGWQATRAGLWIASLGLVVSVAALLALTGVPAGQTMIPPEVNVLVAIAAVVAIAMITAIPHECAHLLFGNADWRTAIRLRPARAVATTGLTHVWCWPASPRFAALVAGLTVDLCLLSLALAMWLVTGHWVAGIAAAVLTARILWQFRLHRNCDGRHIAMMLVDDPLVADHTRAVRGAGWHTLRARHWFWLAATTAGVLVELVLIVGWLVPAAAAAAGVSLSWG